MFSLATVRKAAEALPECDHVLSCTCQTEQLPAVQWLQYFLLGRFKERHKHRHDALHKCIFKKTGPSEKQKRWSGSDHTHGHNNSICRVWSQELQVHSQVQNNSAPGGRAFHIASRALWQGLERTGTPGGRKYAAAKLVAAAAAEPFVQEKDWHLPGEVREEEEGAVRCLGGWWGGVEVVLLVTTFMASLSLGTSCFLGLSAQQRCEGHFCVLSVFESSPSGKQALEDADPVRR